MKEMEGKSKVKLQEMRLKFNKMKILPITNIFWQISFVSVVHMH